MHGETIKNKNDWRIKTRNLVKCVEISFKGHCFPSAKMTEKSDTQRAHLDNYYNN